jgi:predicted secreted protein
MKRILSTVLIASFILTGATTFADLVNDHGVMPVLISEPVPVLYEVKQSVAFELKQEADGFTITFDENITTGYSWIYSLSDEEHLSFISETQMNGLTELVGSGGKHEFKFKVKSDGVSTITFDYQRPWEEESIENITILVYKNADKVMIEEDQPVYAMDSSVTTEVSTTEVFYQNEQIISDVSAQVVDGVMMVPLRSTLEKMGYTVTWNTDSRSVEMHQGAQWTSIKIGENAYFRNRMAPSPLSAAPVIINSRTLVPVEFFSEILSKNIVIDSGDLKFDDQEAVIHSGYVKELTYDETGMMTITLTSDITSEDRLLQTMIHTSKAHTIYQKEVVVGEYVSVISSMMMTFSIPGQSSGYVVY